ncbi:hypothetical protein ACEWY4_007564 [Coilia grayii]|uniref:DDE Tnp4 domain-containing protein n=1 Tax=Coilia grayii TaxID=363190 RepID=A0ABD1KH11_9TELE
MKVALAAQTLSSSVATALRTLRNLGYPEFEDCEATAEFIEVIDTMFDMMNSRNPKGTGFKTPLSPRNWFRSAEVFLRGREFLTSLVTNDRKPLHKSKSTSGNVTHQDGTVSLAAVELSCVIPAEDTEDLPCPFANLPAVLSDHSYLPIRFGSLVDNALVNTPEAAGHEQAMDCTPLPDDHDYHKAPEAAFLDMALDRIQELEEKNEALEKELKELKISCAFVLERFIQSDVNIRLYTSRIICSWTNFLYTLMGSVSIWIEAEDVKAHLPDDFKEFSDTQIIVDCTELKCQTPSSPVIQSEMYSPYKSHCTMKALIGIAPHDPITFISSLYEGSISDKEVFRKSGLIDLLTDDMAIMVDKGFLINDLVKCKVYCPPFLKKSSQMSAPSVLKT